MHNFLAKPKTVVPDGKNVFNTSHTPFSPSKFTTRFTSLLAVFLGSDDSFINGANPGDARNEMEITTPFGCT
jgi:hypothetical protein